MNTIPIGWSIVPLGNDAVYKKGKKPKYLETEIAIDLLPYIDIKAFEKGIVAKYAHVNSGVTVTEEDSLMVWDGARSGFVGKGIKGILGSTLMKINPIASDKEYFHYFLRYKTPEINSKTKGTGIPHVDPQVLWSFEFPLAPLNEQIRIAKKLNSLLAKVQTAQTQLEKIPVLLKRFRQSVLTAATTGNLTKDWRKGKQFGKTVQIGEFASNIRYGTSKKCAYDTEGVPVLRIPNISDNGVNLDDLKFAHFNEKELGSFKLKAGDLLVIRSNGSKELVGKTAIVKEKDTKCLFAGYLIRVRLENRDMILPEYVLFALQSPKLRSVIEIGSRSTSGIHNINSKELANLSFTLPDIKEQKEIVRRVEKLFLLADQIEKQYQSAKAQIDQLTQSILAKAFRGELVPQDPNDEPAEALLARIKSEKQKQATNNKRKPKPSKKKEKAMKPEDASENYLQKLIKNNGSEIQAQQLWQTSKMSIDDFYAQLKTELSQIDEINKSEGLNFRKLVIKNKSS